MSTILLLLSLTFELNKFFSPSAHSLSCTTRPPLECSCCRSTSTYFAWTSRIFEIFSRMCVSTFVLVRIQIFFLWCRCWCFSFKLPPWYTHSNCQRLAVMRSTAVWSNVERKYQFSLLSCVYQKIEISCRFCSSTLTRRRRFSMLGFIEISNNMILAHNSTLSSSSDENAIWGDFCNIE